MFLLVVVGDLNLVGIVVAPFEADTPLIVDPDGKLSLSVPFQFLQSVARRRSQVVKTLSVVQHSELPQSRQMDVAGQSP